MAAPHGTRVAKLSPRCRSAMKTPPLPFVLFTLSLLLPVIGCDVVEYSTSLLSFGTIHSHWTATTTHAEIAPAAPAKSKAPPALTPSAPAPAPASPTPSPAAPPATRRPLPANLFM